jgi:hypothetical protein
MSETEWRRLLDRLPEVRRVLSQLASENSRLDPVRDVLGLEPPAQRSVGWRPFTPEEREAVRLGGWD